MDEGLRPREIQARIRAGQSSEQIASSSGMPLDLVARFEAPVLAERAHVAEKARRTEVRHSSPGLTVDDAVDEALRTRSIPRDTIEWDSWRRDDGRWSVVVEFGNDGQRERAMFTYDLVARAVIADDDLARSLLDPSFRPPAAPSPRLVSVPTRPTDVYDHESAERSVGAVTEIVARPGAVAAVDDHDDRDDGVDIEDSVDETVTDIDHIDHIDDVHDEPADEPDPVRPAATTPRPRSAKGKRASVPSWDEILFGGDSEG